MMSVRILGLTLFALFLAGCGGDDPKEACNQLIESFSAAWSRCGRMPYADAKKQFTTQFASCNPSEVDEDRVNQCSTELNAADCTVINNGGTPASCKGVLSQ